MKFVLNDTDSRIIERLRKKETKTKMLQVGKLFVDLSYQRDPEERKKLLQEMIADNFVPSFVGILEVSAREDGRYAIIDGAGRHYAMTQLLKRTPFETLECKVHYGLTVEEESVLFRFINRQRKAITSHDDWKGRVRSGEKQAREIDSLVRSHGFRVGTGKNGLTGVYSLECVHNDFDTLERTLVTCRQVWADYKIPGTVFGGLGLLLRNTGNADENALRAWLTKNPPNVIVAKIRNEYGGLPRAQRMPFAVAKTIALGYNYNRKTRRISIEALEAAEKANPASFHGNSDGRHVKAAHRKTA